MRPHHLVIALSLAWGAVPAHAQTNALPTGPYIGIRLLKESDAAFAPHRRDRPPADYRFGNGIGPELYYAHELGRRTGWSVSAGGWAFWNKATAMDTAAFKRRAIVLPIIGGLNVRLIDTPHLSLFVSASAGAAYVQHVQQYADRMRVQSGTYGIYGLTVTLWVGVKRFPSSPRYVGPNMGVSYFALERATLHSGFVTFALPARAQ